MDRLTVIVILLTLIAMISSGCGTVHVWGEAAAALEASATDAWLMLQRLPPTTPQTDLTRVYLTENARQWRAFVRAARRDATWGQPLPGDPPPGRQVQP